MDQKSYFERVLASPAIKRKDGWNAHSADIRELLGLSRKAKLPVQGMPAREIQGVKVWVEPATPSVLVPSKWSSTGLLRVKSSKHRVMAECPRCGEHLSAGRLHQHKCTT